MTMRVKEVTETRIAGTSERPVSRARICRGRVRPLPLLPPPMRNSIPEKFLSWAGVAARDAPGSPTRIANSRIVAVTFMADDFTEWSALQRFAQFLHLAANVGRQHLP